MLSVGPSLYGEDFAEQLASVACLFAEPKETYVAVADAMKYVVFPTFVGFSALFLFGAEFFCKPRHDLNPLLPECVFETPWQ